MAHTGTSYFPLWRNLHILVSSTGHLISHNKRHLSQHQTPFPGALVWISHTMYLSWATTKRVGHAATQINHPTSEQEDRRLLRWAKLKHYTTYLLCVSKATLGSLPRADQVQQSLGWSWVTSGDIPLLNNTLQLDLSPSNHDRMLYSAY